MERDLFTLLASGADSEVYRKGLNVYKFYSNKDLSLEQLLLYKEITQSAMRYLENRPFTIKSGKYSFKIDQVNPIKEIYFDNTRKQIVAISPFVNGLNFSFLLNGTFDYKKISSYLLQLRRTPGFTRILFEKQLGELSKELNFHLGVSGINIFPLNLMLVILNEKESILRLIITDLCPGIVKLKSIK